MPRRARRRLPCRACLPGPAFRGLPSRLRLTWGVRHSATPSSSSTSRILRKKLGLAHMSASNTTITCRCAGSGVGGAGQAISCCGTHRVDCIMGRRRAGRSGGARVAAGAGPAHLAERDLLLVAQVPAAAGGGSGIVSISISISISSISISSISISISRSIIRSASSSASAAPAVDVVLEAVVHVARLAVHLALQGRRGAAHSGSGHQEPAPAAGRSAQAELAPRASPAPTFLRVRPVT